MLQFIDYTVSYTALPSTTRKQHAESTGKVNLWKKRWKIKSAQEEECYRSYSLGSDKS